MSEEWGKRLRRRIRLENLIDLERLSLLQEKYARSAGVACGIMDVDGNWVGEPSNSLTYRKRKPLSKQIQD